MSKRQPFGHRNLDGRHRGAVMLALEPRILLDAAYASTLDEISHLAADTGAHGPAGDGASALIAALATEAPTPTEIPETVPAFARPNPIYFIDSSVDDSAAILSALEPDAEVHRIDAGTDGITIIAATLSGRADIPAMHIISHGSQGRLMLGNAVLDTNSMQGEYLSELTAIGRSMASDGDILIYGCDFAAGEKGIEAAKILGGITGADIAASDDLTGAAELGGDWDLEVQTGTIAERSVVADAYTGILWGTNRFAAGWFGDTPPTRPMPRWEPRAGCRARVPSSRVQVLRSPMCLNPAVP
jgi:hypothetical protein